MSFRQIKLVLAREYMTKIRSKAFILATILIPLGFLAFIGVVIGISLWDTDPQLKIAINDQTEQLYPRLARLDSARYVQANGIPEDSLRSMVTAETVNGYVLLSDANVTGDQTPELVYGGSGGISLLNSLRGDLRDAIRQERLERAQVPAQVQQIYSSTINLNSRKLTASGQETEDNTGFLSGIGMAMGMVIFMSLFGYGGLLTRSVIEEKTNRIVEVVASSVKPIELLIGKMAGIGALAVTQIAFWVLAITGIGFAAGPIIGLISGSASLPAEATAPSPAGFEIPAVPLSIIVYFFIFFVLGYLMYSTFFAAVGAAVDSETDTQQFMGPLFVPVMIAYFIMFRAIESPDSTLSVVGSLVPLFSPIVMVTRIAITDVPGWQIALAIALMIATFALAMWTAAKIYQVGILNYGGKASYKELWKWIRQG